MIFLDIETKSDKRLIEVYTNNLSAPKNYKDPEKIAEWLGLKKLESEKALATDPDYAHIVCIGIKEDEEEARTVDFDELKELLNKHHVLVTFNGKSFDIPTIIKVGVKHQSDLPYKFLRACAKKWQNEQHIDLMEFISDGRDYKSLDEYLQIYLGIRKTPIDFSTCSEEELRAHCLEDVENTAKLYKLFSISV